MESRKKRKCITTPNTMDKMRPGCRLSEIDPASEAEYKKLLTVQPYNTYTTPRVKIVNGELEIDFNREPFQDEQLIFRGDTMVWMSNSLELVHCMLKEAMPLSLKCKDEIPIHFEDDRIVFGTLELPQSLLHTNKQQSTKDDSKNKSDELLFRFDSVLQKTDQYFCYRPFVIYFRIKDWKTLISKHKKSGGTLVWRVNAKDHLCVEVVLKKRHGYKACTIPCRYKEESLPYDPPLAKDHHTALWQLPVLLEACDELPEGRNTSTLTIHYYEHAVQIWCEEESNEHVYDSEGGLLTPNKRMNWGTKLLTVSVDARVLKHVCARMKSFKGEDQFVFISADNSPQNCIMLVQKLNYSATARNCAWIQKVNV